MANTHEFTHSSAAGFGTSFHITFAPQAAICQVSLSAVATTAQFPLIAIHFDTMTTAGGLATPLTDHPNTVIANDLTEITGTFLTQAGWANALLNVFLAERF
ncbi:hypothetical protein [Nannocystis pusilla]|uniref:hypothetical protein n=1 Tax=Nannocystis pusilla TaxID=889268 RepID=UPI003B7D72E6